MRIQIRFVIVQSILLCLMWCWHTRLRLSCHDNQRTHVFVHLDGRFFMTLLTLLQLFHEPVIYCFVFRTIFHSRHIDPALQFANQSVLNYKTVSICQHRVFWLAFRIVLFWISMNNFSLYKWIHLYKLLLVSINESISSISDFFKILRSLDHDQETKI